MLCGLESDYRGTQGSSVCRVFGLSVAMTGATRSALVRAGVRRAEDVASVSLHATNHATYLPGATPLHLDLWFERASGRIVGAQAAGRSDVEKRIDVVAAYLHMGATVAQLAQAELCYAPPVGARARCEVVRRGEGRGEPGGDAGGGRVARARDAGELGAVLRRPRAVPPRRAAEGAV